MGAGVGRRATDVTGGEMIRELRVHGVSGTPPRDMLFSDPVPVAPRAASGAPAPGAGDGPVLGDDDLLPGQFEEARQRDFITVYERPGLEPGVDTQAFSWSGTTSGSWVTALWILFAPFAFANVAGWMATRDTWPWLRRLRARPATTAALRVACLGLTALLAAQVTMVVTVVPVTWLPVRGATPTALARLAAATLLGCGVLWVVGVWLLAARSHFTLRAPGAALRRLLTPNPRAMLELVDETASAANAAVVDTTDPARTVVQVCDERPWHPAAILHRLQRLHLATALVVVAWIGLALAGRGLWTVPAVLLGGVVLLVVATSVWPEQPWLGWPTALAPWAGIAAVAWAATVALGTDGGTEGGWEVLQAHLVSGLTVLLLALATVVVAVLAGARSAGAMTFGSLFGGVLGMGAALSMEQWLRPPLESVDEAAWTAANRLSVASTGGGWATMVMLVLVLCLALVAVAQTWLTRPDAAGPPVAEQASRMPAFVRHIVLRAHRVLVAVAWIGAGLLLATVVLGGLDVSGIIAEGGGWGRPGALPDPGAPWVTWVLLGLAGVVVVVTIVSLLRFLVPLRRRTTWMVAGAVVVVVVGWLAWPLVGDVLAALGLSGGPSGTPAGTAADVGAAAVRAERSRTVAEVATWIVVVAPAAAIVNSIVAGVRSGQESRRKVGILWDIGSFWPRWYHPLAPPAYGPVAVQALAEELGRRPRDVLGAHSQGSLLATVALIQMPRGTAPGTYLTYGSQLGDLYPGMFPDVGLDHVVEAVCERHPHLTWVNLWRDTDPIGGHVLTGLDAAAVGVGTGAATGEAMVAHANVPADFTGAVRAHPHSRYEPSEAYRAARVIAGSRRMV